MELTHTHKQYNKLITDVSRQLKFCYQSVVNDNPIDTYTMFLILLRYHINCRGHVDVHTNYSDSHCRTRSSNSMLKVDEVRANRELVVGHPNPSFIV